MSKLKNKKVLMAGLAIAIVLFVAFVILFVFPAFNSNKYGDRLDDIDEHKISSSSINEIKDDLESQNGVQKVTYSNKGGRILSFSISVDPSLDVETAKGYSSIVLDSISKDDKSYYDIQFSIDSKEDSDVYPIIGYKGKNKKEMVF